MNHLLSSTLIWLQMEIYQTEWLNCCGGDTHSYIRTYVHIRRNVYFDKVLGGWAVITVGECLKNEVKGTLPCFFEKVSGCRKWSKRCWYFACSLCLDCVIVCYGSLWWYYGGVLVSWPSDGWDQNMEQKPTFHTFLHTTEIAELEVFLHVFTSIYFVTTS